MPAACQICQRFLRRGTTQHHLIPRACHRNKWFKKTFSREKMQQTVELCRDCHQAVHRFIPSEKELGRHFHALELLRDHPQISKFAAWVKKQR